MAKTWTKRKLTYYGDTTAQVTIEIFSSDGELMPCELKHCGDSLADKVMVALSETPNIRAPLSRIKVQHNVK